MSVLIKGMEMPRVCAQCFMDTPCCKALSGDTNIWKERHPDCPLVEVKEPHDDLVDRGWVRRGRERGMNIEQEIRAQIEKNKGLKLAVGEINNHLSILEGLLRNERDDVQKQVDEAYQRGVEDGRNETWEAVKKISLMSPDEIEKVFPGAAKYNRYNLGYSGVEAIEKLKAYEEKQKADGEIKAGDEVIYNGTTKCLVVRPETNERYASLIDSDGNHYSADYRECKKTSRHFDIDKILAEMRT